jgi:aminoglycoside 6'-N-acetyltransferase
MPSELRVRFDFRPLQTGDLALVRRWLGAPHVARWWGDADEKIADIREHVTSATVRPYLILMDGRPVGYIQSYDIHGEDDHPYNDQPQGTIGMDLSIGEPDLVGKGHGPAIIEAFARRLFDDGAPRVVIDPDPDNARAIRAYEKAGFIPLGPRSSIYGDVILMARDPFPHDET